MEHVAVETGFSERRICRAIGQARSTQRYEAKISDDEEQLREEIVKLASQYGRYGYRMITGMLRNEGWRVNHKRVERIWREEALKVPRRQPRRARLWLSDGSCVRLRPMHRNHVWSYDFMSERTSDGKALKIFTVIDEYSRECLAVDVARHIRSENVIDRLAELFVRKGVPEHIRSDNGPEFTAKAVRDLDKCLPGCLITDIGKPANNRIKGRIQPKRGNVQRCEAIA